MPVSGHLREITGNLVFRKKTGRAHLEEQIPVSSEAMTLTFRKTLLKMLSEPLPGPVLSITPISGPPAFYRLPRSEPPSPEASTDWVWHSLAFPLSCPALSRHAQSPPFSVHPLLGLPLPHLPTLSHQLPWSALTGPALAGNKLSEASP